MGWTDDGRSALALPCAIYRGGTSKAVVLREEDLPAEGTLRDAIVLALFGSPDVRQIDGLGGGDPLTSKLAIVAPTTGGDCDVAFTFGQVSLSAYHVDYRGTCGNISSAIGPFAVDEGWVSPVEPITPVRVWNTNTQRSYVAEVSVVDGHSAIDGDAEISGVPGHGPRVKLDFGDIGGVTTGRLLPTGSPVDSVTVAGKGVQVSIVDASTVCVFVLASDLGIPPTVSPAELGARGEWLDMLEEVRSQAAFRAGLVADAASALSHSPAVPKIFLIAPPQDYRTTADEPIGAESVHLLGRALTNQRPHQAYQATGALATATAAQIPGTVVHKVVGHGVTGEFRIGHPAGVIEAEVRVPRDAGDLRVTRAALTRTARQLLRGQAVVSRRHVQAALERLAG